MQGEVLGEAVIQPRSQFFKPRTREVSVLETLKFLNYDRKKEPSQENKELLLPKNCKWSLKIPGFTRYFGFIKPVARQ
jgi:hypothetical protein